MAEAACETGPEPAAEYSVGDGGHFVVLVDLALAKRARLEHGFHEEVGELVRALLPPVVEVRRDFADVLHDVHRTREISRTHILRQPRQPI